MKTYFVIAVYFLTEKLVKGDITGGSFFKNRFLKDDALQTFDKIGPKMCIKRCMQNIDCKAINFWRSQLKCTLLRGNVANVRNDDIQSYLSEENGVDFTFIERWTTKEDSCWPVNPCSAQHVCVPSHKNQPVCTKYVSPCSSRPCLYGICDISGSSYTCTCEPGFCGKNCDAFGGTWSNPTCAPGRHTIVQLFEWKWTDVAAECEQFLGPYGYCGVQVSPPSENRVVTSPNRPWHERYQPVSYKLVSRSGNEDQFRDMVQRCNKVNVRIYADSVINHMCGAGAQGTGTGGTLWDSGNLNYPGVPFSSWDFNGPEECHTSDLNIHDYGNKEEVRNCRLFSMSDLKLGKDYVRDKIAGYMNHLIDIGVAGFRIDAAKHTWPGDLQAIFGRLKDLNSEYFSGGTKPFIFQEVIDLGGEAISASEYTGFARVTNFVYGVKLTEVFRNQSQAKWLKTWGAARGMPASYDVVVFIDNHDNQRGSSVLTHKDPKHYKMATEFMLAHPYGFTRVMSSYSFGSYDEGPPHNGDMSIQSVDWGSDFSCGHGWVCEHRWRQIYNMVAFRNVVAGTDVDHWWDNGNYQIGFSRGNKGFFLLNADTSDLNVNLQTGLPSGTYCDVISGNYDGISCNSTQIHVNTDGTAHFQISSGSDDPALAIHIGAKIGSQKKVTT